MNDYLPQVQEKYGDRIEFQILDINDPENFALLVGLEKMYGVPQEQAGVPVIFIGSTVMIGDSVIEEHLEKKIDFYLAQGGVDYPPVEQVRAATSTATPTAEPSPVTTPTPTPAATAVAGQKPIALAYFYKEGCQECSRANVEIEYVQKLYPQVTVDGFNIAENSALNEWLSERYGVPEEKRLTAPMVFIGDDYLLGEAVNARNLQPLVEKYRLTGAEPVWRNWDEERGIAESRIIERFKSFGALTVMFNGLIDGLNPCAFATIVFFVSYLTFTGRKGREILLVGAAFTIGVFLTYLLVGVGLLRFLVALPFLSALAPWIYLLTAALCLILAVYSFRDFLVARRGRPQEMTLRMSLTLRRWVNRVIREGAQMRAYVLVAFVTGFIVSLIELFCTGQVYLPTILFVLGVPKLRVSAFFYLVLYNLMFVTPLIVVFLLTFYGTTSQQLGQFINTHTAQIKLLTATVFLVLAVWLVYAAWPVLAAVV